MPLHPPHTKPMVFVFMCLLEVADCEDLHEGVHAAQGEELVVVGEGHVDDKVFVDFKAVELLQGGEVE